MLGRMSTDELSRSTSPADDHPAAVRTPLHRRPWVLSLALLTVIFIGYACRRISHSTRIQPMPPHASYYPMLVTHIFPRPCPQLGEAGILDELACADVGHGEVDLVTPVIRGVALDRGRTL
jgi:hypothetical protein